jgi:4-amino-4-deoxy-L-arabinose transferase-like glycosyltransferase
MVRRCAKATKYDGCAMRATTLATCAVLGAATIGLRVPLLAPRLAHWDAVNYALGLHVFDVTAHQPHPPGSPFFILVGRATLALTGDDNAALQLISVLASAGAVVAEFALARSVFGRPAAIVASVALMTQPVFWGYGTTATAWTVLALLAICITLMCRLLQQGRPRLVYPSALLIGLASGFRTDAAMFLGPLWLWSVCTATRSWRRRALAVGLAAVCALAWLVPVAASAGGAAAWTERLLALLPAADASPPAEARQLAANTAIAFGTLAFTFGPLLAVALVLDYRCAWRWTRSVLGSRTGVFWALAILPAFTFLWWVDSTEPGHDLVFAGALAALGGGLIVHVARTKRALLAGVATVVALQAGVFLLARPVTDRPLAWTLDSMLLNVTAPGLAEQQSSLDQTIRLIRTEFDPSQTLLVTLIDQDPYRFLMYYLPEYHVVRLDPTTSTVLSAQARTQGNWAPVTGCLLSGDLRQAVVVLARPYEPGTVPIGAELLSSADNDGPFQVWSLPAESYVGFDFGDC